MRPLTVFFATRQLVAEVDVALEAPVVTRGDLAERGFGRSVVKGVMDCSGCGVAAVRERCLELGFDASVGLLAEILAELVTQLARSNRLFTDMVGPAGKVGISAIVSAGVSEVLAVDPWAGTAAGAAGALAVATPGFVRVVKSLAGQRPRNSDPLTLATRQLVGKTIGVLSGQSDVIQSCPTARMAQ